MTDKQVVRLLLGSKLINNAQIARELFPERHDPRRYFYSIVADGRLKKKHIDAIIKLFDDLGLQIKD